MTAAFDLQRERLYAAEAPLWGQRFESIAVAQEYVDGIVTAPTWQARKPEVARVQVVAPAHVGLDELRGRVFWEDGFFVALPQWTRFERYVLHELAHLLAFEPGDPYHGPRYAGAYLELVTSNMGQEVGRLLLLGYLAHGVRFLPHPCSSLRPHEQASDQTP